MPRINISEAEYEAVVGAAIDAQDAGNMGDARRLDRLARKMNLAISAANPMTKLSGKHHYKTWEDMPSCLST